MIIRMDVANISKMGRVTKGVRLINLKDNNKVASISVVDKEETMEDQVENTETQEQAKDTEQYPFFQEKIISREIENKMNREREMYEKRKLDAKQKGKKKRRKVINNVPRGTLTK